MHSLQRMFERSISTDEIELVIAIGEVIEEYPTDKPYPSVLIPGFIGKRPIHVVVAQTPEKLCVVVTAYQPDKTVWEPDFKTKKRRK
ncbi:DUF4258 domain-containing protein [Rhodoflexus caldus]|uniref:DUF4258 domain-containing protein n=1 Tax=Rhodoflexus caldus TaxID=2891236 RepID=UPI00202A9B80|nr:DUF4258 domain-containing protein [Rhodoflexus caldus]